MIELISLYKRIEERRERGEKHLIVSTFTGISFATSIFIGFMIASLQSNPNLFFLASFVCLIITFPLFNIVALHIWDKLVSKWRVSDDLEKRFKYHHFMYNEQVKIVKNNLSGPQQKAEQLRLYKNFSAKIEQLGLEFIPPKEITKARIKEIKSRINNPDDERDYDLG